MFILTSHVWHHSCHTTQHTPWFPPPTSLSPPLPHCHNDYNYNRQWWSDNNTSKDKDNLTPNFVFIDRDIENRSSWRIRAASTEVQHFHEFFRTSTRTMKILLDLLIRDNLRPEKSHPDYLLWALFFLKLYPKQSLECSVLGASASAIDAKTHRK